MDLYEFLGAVAVPVVQPRLRDMRDAVHGLPHIPDVGGGVFDFQTQAYHLSTVRKNKAFDSPQAYVSCRAHDACKVSWIVLLADPEVLKEGFGITSQVAQLVVLGRNAHAGDISKEQLAKDNKLMKHELARSSRPAAAMAEAEGPIPSLQSVYRHKASEHSKTRSLRRTHTQEELGHFLAGMSMPNEETPTEVYCLDFEVGGDLFVPFTSLHNMRHCVNFAARGQQLRVVLDFTHDVCLQRLKLGVLAVLGQRFDHGVSHNAVLPVVFLISRREIAEGYSRLIKTAKEVGGDTGHRSPYK